jgi:homoserine/homoserine lactone efflux protein
VASEKAFNVIRFVGVAYLIVSGVRMLIQQHPAPEPSEQSIKGDSSFKLFIQGLITQLINPKAILFFIALLPQFVSTERPIVGQFVVLGLISILVETPVLMGYGWLAASGGKLLPKKFADIPDRIAGVFLIGAGAALGLRKL